MRALACVDERLFEAGITGGVVAWLHDEIVVEVCVEDSEQTAGIVKQAMIGAFVERLLKGWSSHIPAGTGAMRSECFETP
jgi:hypothetical protein